MALTPIGGTPQQIPTDQTQGAGQVNNQPTTGAGSTAPTGSVPGAPSDPSYSVVLDSLTKFMPQVTGEVLDVMLLEITVKMKETEEASQKDKIKVDQEAKRTALAEKADKLKEAETKIQEAIDKEKNASIWDKIKMAFQALGALLAIVAGLALIATGAGAAAGAALIAIGVIGLIMVIDSAVKMGTGHGIAGAIAKAGGASDEYANKCDFGFGIAMAGLALIAAVACFFIPGGQAMAVNSFAQSLQAFGSIASASIAIVNATGDATVAVIKYEAQTEKAEGQKTQAEAKQMEAWIKQIDDFIDQALQRLMGAMDRFNAMLDGIMEAIQDQAKTVAKAKFTG